MSEPQLVSDVTTDEARKAHAKLVLEQLLEKFETVELKSYEYSNIGTQLFVKFGFKIDDTYTVGLSVQI
jgi:hypothetical protein